MKLINYFSKNLSSRQKQYEALRALAFKEGTLEEVALRFEYKPQSLRNLVSKLLKGEYELIPEIKRGPKGRRISSEAEKMIIMLRRKKKLNSSEICKELNNKNIKISVRTVERFLSDSGFKKLARRTKKERGIDQEGGSIPERSMKLGFNKLKPFRKECQVAGVFFLLPYILESGIIDIVKNCSLPSSSIINSTQAALSMLLLKLLGNERLSHIDQYNNDEGFGLFAGLNVLPKPTYMTTYSCRTGPSEVLEFQKQILGKFLKSYPEMYQSKIINLDFHSIPHFGSESEMEKVWCGSRGKSLKGAQTFFAQDSNSKALIYTRADIKRREAAEEINNFVDYWISLKGIVQETLVFDSTLTRYDILYDLNERNIKFITLRRRSKSLVSEINEFPSADWERIFLNIPKRKYKYIRVHESKVLLKKGEELFRQIIIKDHGRAEPTFVITNNWTLKKKDILKIYAKRWRIENKFAELVEFFNLNSLSSPVMTRIHFDLLWTIIADTLYHLFAMDLSRFEKCKAKRIFRKFINMPGQIEYNGKEILVKIRKRAVTPILLGVDKLRKPVNIPWLGNRTLKFIWTA